MTHKTGSSPQVPRVRTRLATFRIKFEAQQLLEEAATALENHLKAQGELKSSPCFAAILDQALAHGYGAPSSSLSLQKLAGSPSQADKTVVYA